MMRFLFGVVRDHMNWAHGFFLLGWTGGAVSGFATGGRKKHMMVSGRRFKTKKGRTWGGVGPAYNYN